MRFPPLPSAGEVDADAADAVRTFDDLPPPNAWRARRHRLPSRDPRPLRRARPFRLATAAACVVLALCSVTPASSQAAKPFGLPFAEPPGPGTWFVAQSYGNTIYAHAERRAIYKSGQGLHMGLDLAAACGTPVVAIGDGVVLSVDGRGGSPPHNLMINHENGYVSLYGHLLERPKLEVGRRVKRGDTVALSGDMYGTCYSAPHLHLEIRRPSLEDLVNPVSLIEADWHSLLLLGLSSPAFERDLDAPRRGQAIDDQPAIRLGGPLLNEFERAWPAGK
jgi:murein DD-endopeptidase MepM/ murein hydrolase activator NlpD